MSMRIGVYLLVAALAVGCTQVGSESAKIDQAVQTRVSMTGEARPSAQTYLACRDEVERALRRELAFFYPACVDTQQGGFTHALPDDWEKLSPTQRRKNAVYQTRLTWTAAEVARRRPDLREEYLKYARHGFEFLKNKMWDAQQGGFFWLVDETGNMVPEMTDKHSYGQAFGIYTCVNVYEATKDPAALVLAMKGFRWLDEHGHDARNGGYFEAYTRAGEVITDARKSFDPKNPNDVLGGRYGYKSMNAHIHLMEALTVLAIAKPDDALVRRRLDEVFLIVRDKIAVQPGALHLSFSPNWKPVPMYDSFGHDVETAYLLWEGDTVRHQKPNSKTRMVARSLVDHALEAGWDEALGGFYYEGFTFGKAFNKGKSWWTQAEGLNALLLMHEVFGAEDAKYWKAFASQWAFIKAFQIDRKTGGWYGQVAGDGSVSDPVLLQPWKANYHSGRAMLNVSDRLTDLARGTQAER